MLTCIMQNSLDETNRCLFFILHERPYMAGSTMPVVHNMQVEPRYKPDLHNQNPCSNAFMKEYSSAPPAVLIARLNSINGASKTLSIAGFFERDCGISPK